MGLIDDIKKDAKGNKTIIQSTEAQKLSGILNNLFYLPKNINGETAFVKAVMTRGTGTQERIGLHASALTVKDNDFCIRQQVLSLLYKQLQGEQLGVGIKRIFEQGNAIHEKWQRLFIRGGFSSVNQLDVTQYNKKYMISFTPDIICRIPEFYDDFMVGEIKSVNTFQFQRMSRHPSAWKQLQWYLYLSKIKKGFVLSEDKNTQEFKIEVYDFDMNIVTPFIERAEQINFYYERVLNEHKMVKRPKDAKSSDCKRCMNCSMKEVCWNGVGERIK